MRISVFGLGYVGTVCSACLAQRGHSVVGVDKVEAKVDLIQSGRAPIIEPAIDDLVKQNVDAKRLVATLDVDEAVSSTDMSIVCVGTPSQSNGALSLAAIEKVSAEIGQAIRAKSTRHEVVIRSTVVPGTTRKIIAPKLIEASGIMPGNGLGIAFNPEFLREGSSVADFNTPSKTIVGALDEATAANVMSLYGDLTGAKVITEIETAELVKYVDNAWHALKVAFANEIGVIASSLDIDSREVMSIFLRTNVSISQPPICGRALPLVAPAYPKICVPSHIWAANWISVCQCSIIFSRAIRWWSSAVLNGLSASARNASLFSGSALRRRQTICVIAHL